MAMTVKELREALKQYPDDMEVIVQSDSEGNSYSPLYCVDGNAVYIAREPWYGDVFSTDWTSDEADMDEEEWDEMLRMPRSLILVPVN
jgi:hypothetical protein